jgi:hypothetical protein
MIKIELGQHAALPSISLSRSLFCLCSAWALNGVCAGVKQKRVIVLNVDFKCISAPHWS